MLKDYFRYRRPVVCFYCCVLLFFPLVCYLYRLPLTPVCYVLLIFSFLFLCWAVADGLRFRQRLLLLQQASACPSLYVQRLPEPTQPLEVRYQQMIEQLYRLLQQQTDTLNATHGQQVEYYTMWLHQIKTPIAAIRLSLQSGDCAPALLEQELFKIEQYVEMALQYVKIQQLANDLVLQEYDVEEIVRQSVKKYAPLFIYKKLSINITPMALRAPTDSKWLSFIIEQLLSNAIKYTNQGGVQILPAAAAWSLKIVGSAFGRRI